MPARVEGQDLIHQGFHQDRIDARRRLVEEDDPRLRDEGARELEQLELPPREGAGEVPHHRFEAAEHDDLARPFAVAHLFAAHRAGREPVVPEPFAALAGRDEHHVLEHRHLRERARDLKRAGNSGHEHLVGSEAVDPAPGEPDPSPIRAFQTRDGVEERRLARPVRTYQRVERPRLDGEVHLVDRPQAPEPLGESLHLEKRLAHAPVLFRPRSRSRSRSRSRLPSGVEGASSPAPSWRPYFMIRPWGPFRSRSRA